MTDPAAFRFDPLQVAAWLLIIGVSVAFLFLGEPLLVPLAIALFVWILLGAIRSSLDRLMPKRFDVPVWALNVVAIATIVLAT